MFSVAAAVAVATTTSQVPQDPEATCTRGGKVPVTPRPTLRWEVGGSLGDPPARREDAAPILTEEVPPSLLASCQDPTPGGGGPGPRVVVWEW